MSIPAGIKSTTGYKVGQAVMSDKIDGPKMPSTHQSGQPAHHRKMGRITIEPAENGVTVTHQPPNEKGEGGFSYEKQKNHVFNSAQEAHAHVGKLMDCGPDGDGE